MVSCVGLAFLHLTVSPCRLSLGPRDFLLVTQWSRTQHLCSSQSPVLATFSSLSAFLLSIHEDEHLTSLPAQHSQE